MGLEDIVTFLERIGDPVQVEKEEELLVLTTIAGFISPFYEFQYSLSAWAASRGVGDSSAAQYVGSFIQSLASVSQSLSSSEAFQELSEEAATPGGLNEGTLVELRENGFFARIDNVADGTLRRMQG